jgi:hypothetical protein
MDLRRRLSLVATLTVVAALLAICIPQRAVSTPAQTKLVATQSTDPYIKLVPTNRHNKFGNPIYRLETYVNGQLQNKYDAVTGRAHTQTYDRHIPGRHAPLPDGEYQVIPDILEAWNPEIGSTFIDIQPMFKTGRSLLGIHYDPSYERTRDEDGTEGCIALTNKRDRDAVNQFVKNYRPTRLLVDIQ